MARPILIGESNPHSDDPAHALYPSPAGCSGWRLWRMLYEVNGTSRARYLQCFQRCNVADLPIMETSGGAVLVPEDLAKMFRRSTVVLLGDKVRRHFDLPRVLIHPLVVDGVTYWQIPHPSGMNRFYNDPACRYLVGRLLADLMEE